MVKRLYTIAALSAAVALSVSVALSRAGTDHGAPAAGHIASASSAGSSYLATLKPGSAGSHAVKALAAAARAAVPGANHGASVSGAAAAAADPSSAPVLVSVQGASHVLAGGAQRATPVAVSEDHAMQAIFKGGMWLPNANGGREYAKYDHHMIHENGDWTWVGKVQTDHGLQSAVITFGKDAVFGRIPQASGNALRLVTADGKKLLVQTDGGKMASSSENLQLHARQDFMVPQHSAEGARSRTASAADQVASAAQTVASAATTSGSPTIDVMVAYTPGLVSAYGSASAALTRINNLVDITNQAYTDSGVNQRIRLVHTMQVSYTDTNDNTKALDDITGKDGDGNPISIPSSLQGVASARTQYGADLVVLLRHFNNAGNNGCGVGWLIGGGEQQIEPSLDNAFGYSVVQDGSDSGYYCLDTTFAHELGHNMGSAHDRANASKDSNGNPIPGAYSYSFGYDAGGTTGFSTIMAYGTDTQTPLNLFSNPNISKCENSPCGVADTASNSADNVHSLNNTAGLIAQFEGTKVVQSAFRAHNDVNGDGKSDLLLEYGDNQRFGYWILNGQQLVGTWSISTNSAYHVIATGDFNGDGYLDIAWTSAARDVRLWLGNGSGFSMGHPVATLGPGWKVVGAADINGDGDSDLLLEYGNNQRFGYWILNGQKLVGTWSTSTSSAYRIVGTGDFNGDGHTDIAWTSSSNDIRLWLGNGSSFSMGHPVGTYTPGWKVVGTGDMNGDGKTDLLLQYGNNERFGYWILNGQQLVGTWSISTSPAYRFVSAGDFDGDGKLDIDWATSQGDNRVWFGNGVGFSMDHPVGTASAGWVPIADLP